MKKKDCSEIIKKEIIQNVYDEIKNEYNSKFS